MAIDARREPAGFLRVTVSGRWPSADEQTRVREALIRDRVMDLQTSATPVLIDLRGVTERPTPDDLQRAVAAAIQQKVTRLRRAILVGTPEQREIARRIQQLGTYEGADVGVFTEEGDAVAWLGLPS